jgi:FMN phosphatase YigB (HAD superfamily)
MIAVAFGLFGTLLTDADRLVPATRAVALREAQRFDLTIDVAAIEDAPRARTHAALAERVHALLQGRTALVALEAQIRTEEASRVGESDILAAARQTVAQLSSLNIARAILTNGAGAIARRAASLIGFDGPVLVGEDIGVRKLDRAAFTSLVEVFSLPPERIWYVTGKPSELHAAQSFGFRTVALCALDCGTNADDQNAVADNRIAQLDELLPLLAEPYTRALLGMRYVMQSTLAWRDGHFVPGVCYELDE